ncbi:adenylyl-sulfate kinase [Pseudomonas mosselii]|uniref:adenylyl-sulfate kinase n=1 Tax=Pseudomonas mosselii TaxID=78327 RepID=UPI000BB483A7|nr:adenylyl-sulfate kinase [Pseudomonas mosselii]ATB64076.1 adenylyl-sulfate kinase [Pseudomonas mosselii]MDH1099527.1 adenylyl-sulfate kinase [Pseudomonas mosselii]
MKSVVNAYNLSRTAQRTKKNGHVGGVIWITGLSGAGKSTLAARLDQELSRINYASYVLDGDEIRTGLNANLGFSADDRNENIRRAAHAAALLANAGLICIAAFISPYRDSRRLAREICGENFHEVYLSTQLEVCEARDPKGLYKKARAGKICSFTGISAPYEHPEHPEITIDTSQETIEASTRQLLEFVTRNFKRMD